ncbi:MAG: hypothetical protein QXH39_03720 [Conexivisphaerales archaeon]
MLDVFSREWIAYVLSSYSSKEYATQSVDKALHRHPVAAGKVIMYSDNGSQYPCIQGFYEAAWYYQRFIAYDTPEQNAFIESFHDKKEYVWPFEFSSF